MGGEDHGKGGAVHEIAKGLEIGRPLRDRRNESRGHSRVLHVLVETDIAAQPAGTLGQGLLPQPDEQSVEVGFADLVPVQAPGDGEGHGENGIAEGIVARLLSRLVDQPEKILFQAPRIGNVGAGRAVGWAAVEHAHRWTLGASRHETGQCRAPRDHETTTKTSVWRRTPRSNVRWRRFDPRRRKDRSAGGGGDDRMFINHRETRRRSPIA